MGITPYDNQSSISLIHRYRSFNGYLGQKHAFFPAGASFFPAGANRNGVITNHAGNPSDYEVYRATEIRARYFAARRLEINAIVPYVSNTEKYNGNTSTLAGLGDINIYAGYHLLRKLDRKVINQRLIVGLGIKLPTGKYNAENFEGIKYNTLSQTGTGSTDGFVYFNYMAGYKKAGVSLSGTYKVNGENADRVSIANSTTGYLNLFYNVGITNTVKMVPSAQLAYEYSGGEKYRGVRTGEHVMNNLMSGVGVDVFVKNITFNLAVQTKAWAAADDHPQPSGRVVIGVTYNFNQLYYLLN
ncbi:hypothetical protein GCM10023149_01310 [Mucilaginibacter gynuensis]|uniref:Outer membrane beta-barrel porin/alpha-amylase n=1 Tax=Mucilaginibacter gynuensis TaxID=1302236 RepID=A0ABP8FNH4_9SPHI